MMLSFPNCSFNKQVVYVPFDANGDMVGDTTIDLLSHEPPNAKWADGFRPVDVDFDACGRLLVTSDGSRPDYAGSKIVRIEYSGSEFATVSPSAEDTVQSSADDSTIAPTYEETFVDTMEPTNLNLRRN